MTMSLLANAIGLVGSALCIGAFIYSNLAGSIDLRLFNALNLAGGLLLVGSLSVHFNLAAMVLEVTWSLIAGFGLIRALWRPA